MFISEIRLKNFRNYRECFLTLNQKVNILRGSNAQGKTNLAEAVYYVCVGRSPRTSRDRELIRWDTEAAYVSAAAQKSYGKIKVECYLTKNEKRISINSVPISRMGELMGAINAVFFSPDELKVVKDGPSDRRRFMDIDICQLSKTYFYALNRYNKILAQRNKLLKKGGDIGAQLDVWNLQLADPAAKIIAARADFVDKLKAHAKEAHAYLSDGAENLEVEYEGIAGWRDGDIKAAFLAELKKTREKDIFNGYTNSGIHKDDLQLTVNGVDVRAYGSQGQQRTAILALKLAELEIFAAEIGEYPVLILDDVLSELDPKRQQKLLERIKTVQTIITCTGMSIEIPDATIFEVKAGEIF
jgi:DNA replication and repair protein RecF